MNSKSGFRAVFDREWNRILRSKICIWGLIVAPILSCCLLLYLMHAGLPQKIPVAVVDLDNTTMSRALVRQLDASSKTDIAFKDLSFREARILMERGQIYGIFMIPKNFVKDALSGNQPKLVFYTNNTFYVSGSLLYQDMKTLAVLASASIGLKVGEAKGVSRTQLMPVLQPISIQTHALNNPWLNYSIYLNNVLVPGILFLVVMMFTVSSLGSEVKRGDGLRLLQMSQQSMTKLLIGKLLPYTCIGMLLALLFMSLFYYYNKFPLNSGFLPTFFNYLALVLAAQGMGLTFMGLFANYRLALSVASLWGVSSFSISGFSFPSQAMDPTLQAISYLFPLRHFFLIYSGQALNGIPWGYSSYHYASLLGFLVIGFMFAPRIKKFLYANKYEE